MGNLVDTRRFAVAGIFDDFTNSKPSFEYSASGYSSVFKECLMELLQTTSIHYIHDPIYMEPCRRVGGVKNEDFNLCQIYMQLTNEQVYVTRKEPYILSLHSVIDAYAEFVMNYRRRVWLEPLIIHAAKEYELVVYVKSRNEKYNTLVRRFLHDWSINWVAAENPEEVVNVLKENTVEC